MSSGTQREAPPACVQRAWAVQVPRHARTCSEQCRALLGRRLGHIAVVMMMAAVEAEAAAMAVLAPEKGRGLCMGTAQPLSGGSACQSLCHLHKYQLSNLLGTVTAATQAANFIGKLEQSKNVNMSIAIKHFKELLEFS